jgi:hypothetical protein
MGSATLSCYAFDPETGNYTYVLLAVTGDWEQYNQSAEAERLVDRNSALMALFIIMLSLI